MRRSKYHCGSRTLPYSTLVVPRERGVLDATVPLCCARGHGVLQPGISTTTSIVPEHNSFGATRLGKEYGPGGPAVGVEEIERTPPVTKGQREENSIGRAARAQVVVHPATQDLRTLSRAQHGLGQARSPRPVMVLLEVPARLEVAPG